MRAPRGFGKNYFSLVSIQAHTSAVTMQAKISQSLLHISFNLQDSSDEALDAPPDELLCLELPKEPDSRKGRRKPCFCNIFFKQQAFNALKNALLNQAPLCKCRKTKSGISPPRILFTLTKIFIL